MKLEALAPYSRETLERLAEVLKQHGVVPWLNPATNSIGIKNFNFAQHRPFTQDPCREE